VKVLHVVPSLSPLRGGPSFAARSIAHALVEAGAAVDVVTTDDDGPGRAEVPLRTWVKDGGVRYQYFPRQTRRYTVSVPLSRWLLRNATSYDLLHIHAVFSYPTLPAALAAVRWEVPYIVRPLGILNRWGREHEKKVLKKLSFALLERRILRSAGAIHYNTELEMQEAAELRIDGRGVVIPNPVDLPPPGVCNPAWFHDEFPATRDGEVILVLSRLHEKKGIDLVLAGFPQIRAEFPKAQLVLAGEGSPEFVAGLRRRVAELGVQASVIWTGFLDGPQKWSAMAAASVFVLPSYSENFGIAVVEAMAAGTPVVISDAVGIHREVADSRAGFVVPCAVEPLAEALQRVLAQPERGREMGRNGRRLVETAFSSAAVGPRLMDLYGELVGGPVGGRR
jgi:glycosyltransferase involved in cell wall biosynthesis